MSTYPWTPPAGTATITGMIDDEDLDAIYERAWNDGYRAAVNELRVLLDGLPVADEGDPFR